jgi:porphyrinogen peroxidase
VRTSAAGWRPRLERKNRLLHNAQMTSNTHQPGISLPVPALAQHLFFNLKPSAETALARSALRQLLQASDGKRSVIGLSLRLCHELGISAPAELKAFAPPAKSKIKLPDTQSDVWIWLRSKAQDDGLQQAALLSAQRDFMHVLGDQFDLKDSVHCFRHGSGRDLTGYEDGTENPKGKRALAAGLSAGGSSFVAIQKWQHRWAKIEAMSERERNLAVGRVRSSNAELDTAPPSAHVKRTAQEDFTLSDGSAGFSLRRSMPWKDAQQSGLMFVSFGKNFEAFEAQLARMTGAEDGITDAMFRMSKPVSGAYFWCPPARSMPN